MLKKIKGDRHQKRARSPQETMPAVLSNGDQVSGLVQVTSARVGRTHGAGCSSSAEALPAAHHPGDFRDPARPGPGEAQSHTRKGPGAASRASGRVWSGRASGPAAAQSSKPTRARESGRRGRAPRAGRRSRRRSRSATPSPARPRLPGFRGRARPGRGEAVRSSLT